MAMTMIPESPAWEENFLIHLASHGMLNKAAAAVGTTAAQVKKHMTDCIEFETAVEDALETATDRLEEAARGRAIDGVTKTIYYKGDEVGTEQVYSDSLMALFLKAKRKSQFGDKTEISGANGQPLTVNIRTFGTPEQAAVETLHALIVPTLPTPQAEDFV